MTFKITFKASVWRDLKNIDKKQAEKILDHLETDLAEHADSYPSLSGNFVGLKKYRVGNYRVIYALVEDRVIVLRIKHRRDAYK